MNFSKWTQFDEISARRRAYWNAGRGTRDTASSLFTLAEPTRVMLAIAALCEVQEHQGLVSGFLVREHAVRRAEPNYAARPSARNV